MTIQNVPPFDVITVDLTAHPLPFGGLALVPVSDAGRDWLRPHEYCGGVFLWPSACMTGFPADAIGFEPQDWPEIVSAAREAGLIVALYDNDANGHCRHCGRDNRGYETDPCADECPQYD